DGDNQDDKAVMENLEEEGTDSGSRQDASLRLQKGEESVRQEGCSKQTALETMDDGLEQAAAAGAALVRASDSSDGSWGPAAATLSRGDGGSSSGGWRQLGLPPPLPPAVQAAVARCRRLGKKGTAVALGEGRRDSGLAFFLFHRWQWVEDWDNQDDKAVMENLEEEGTDSGSRQDGSLRLQEGEESISQEGCSKQTALETMDDGEKHRSITDGLVDVESHKEIVSKVRDCLQADETRVIAIHGTGGAGKTTLLKMISVEFCNKQDSGFDVVIVATSSKHNQHKKKVQREIGEQLGLFLLASGPPFLESLQAAVLRQALSQKKFLLILDGVQQMDWDRIGIPLLNKIHKSKIVFATDAFEGMENVEVVKMNGLNESESWELFLRNVKDEAVCKDESIKPLAKQIVAKCNGLPLALTVVGRALADKKTPQDWQDAIHKMDFLTKEHESREQFVVHYSLKFSYDYLKDDTLRFCLLYCCLFPENYSIGIEELIRYWFGEGLLHDIDIDTAYTTGHTVINELKAAFLLEDGNDKECEVKMHDVVREFALQLTSSANKQSDIFLVHSGIGLSHVCDVEKWKNATRISLMHNEIEFFPSKIRRCPNLSTLLVNRNISLKQMPKDLFKHMPALYVLDLSCTGIEELPRAIGSLSKLQFLSLSNTYIKSIPKEVGKLVQLRQLDLSSMSGLSDVPQKAISTLSKLQSLNLYNTRQWCIQQQGYNKPRKACIDDLKLLHQLKDLKLTINSLISLLELQSNPSLCRTVKALSLQQVDGLTSNIISEIFGKLERLQVLQISELSQLNEICFTSHQLQSLEVLSVEHLPQVTFIVAESSDYLFLQRLRRLQIVGCHGFKDLEWIHQLSALQYIELRVCYGIEEIRTAVEVEKEVNKDCSFHMLQTLILWDLPRLQRISPSSLFLPALECLEVFHCPKLKELPLTVKSARKLKNIHGHQEWWDGLEWDDQSVKLTFLPHFKDPSRPVSSPAGSVNDVPGEHFFCMALLALESHILRLRNLSSPIPFYRLCLFFNNIG
ncbi:hypothetical protein Taro_007766, partial [Colocasia esculenta]|nr:hypothetical protein [Colocasia esculenta]